MNDELGDEIHRAARSVAYEWPGVIELEDLEQEMHLYLLERPDEMGKLRANPEIRFTWLRRIGHQVASKARSDTDVFTGNIQYGAGEVRRSLKNGVMTKTTAEIKNGSVTQSEYLDFTEGFELLRGRNERYATAIIDAYMHGDYDFSGSTSASLLRRSIESLTRCMNQVHKRRHAVHEDGPGSRKAISNAAAQAAKSMDWHGNYAGEAGRR